MPPRRATSAGSLRPLPAARLTAPPPPGELSKQGLRGLEASGTDGQGAGESLGSRLAVTQTCHRPASDLSFPPGDHWRGGVPAGQRPRFPQAGAAAVQGAGRDRPPAPGRVPWAGLGGPLPLRRTPLLTRPPLTMPGGADAGDQQVVAERKSAKPGAPGSRRAGQRSGRPGAGARPGRGHPPVIINSSCGSLPGLSSLPSLQRGQRLRTRGLLTQTWVYASRTAPYQLCDPRRQIAFSFLEKRLTEE